MKAMIKSLIGFAVAFILLFPSILIISTTFDAIDDAVATHPDRTGSDIDVNASTVAITSNMQTVFMFVYAIWGISFFVAMFISYKVDLQRKQEEAYLQQGGYDDEEYY